MDEIQDIENVDTELEFLHENVNGKNIGKEIAVIKDETKTDMGQTIPNVVQTVYDIEETTDAPVTEKGVQKNSGNVSENNTNEKNPTTVDENKSHNSSNSISNCKRQAKQGNTDGGGHSLPTDNKLSIAKTDDISKSERKTSLTVPTTLQTDSKLLPDSRRDSSAVNIKAQGSKISLLSSVSQKSMHQKTDFAIIQMPPDDKKDVPTYEDSWIRVAIPYLPLWLAVLCLVFNIVISGSGTIISGLCIFCCAKSRVPTKYDQDPILISCVNLWVGLAQLFTVTFLLVGWFWSIAWGVRMVMLSFEHRHELKEQRELQLKQQTISAFGRSISRRM